MRRTLLVGVALALVLPFSAWGMDATVRNSGLLYEETMELCRNGRGYCNERSFDAEEYTLLINDFQGLGHGNEVGYMRVIYKAGSQMGEGTILALPFPRRYDYTSACSDPDTWELSEDRKTLSYSYYLENTLTFEEEVYREPGVYLYTVDLPSGKVIETVEPLTYESSLHTFTNAQGFTVEKVLEGAQGTAVLRWRDPYSNLRDYELYLIRKTGTPVVRRLVLPSTTEVDHYPTDRAPDEMFLNEDGSVLTYIYRFEEALFNDRGDLLHDSGTYTYTVDTATGELKVSHEAESSPSSPSLGAEGTTFVDIAPGDWFAPYVEVCAQEGLMKGVGGGRFNPQGTVTMAEAATIAARLHHLRNGGDGNLPKAPEEWGRMTLTFEDGETYHFYSSVYDWDLGSYKDGWLWGGRTGGLLYFKRAEGWDGRDYQRVTLKVWVSDTPLQGTAEVPNNVGASLRFIPEDFRETYDTLRYTPQTPPSQWYRDTDYYLVSQDLGFSCGDYYAQRDDLVRALDKVVGSELTPINHITDYPDSSTAYDDEEREGVLRLYNAGILTGTDAAGSFSPSGYLTRAEVAAMAARILRPELRIAFAPEKPVYQRYTLTELEGVSVGDWFDRLSPDLLQFDRMDGGQVVGEALLRADGTVIDLPEGSFLDQYTAPTNTQPWPLLVLGRQDLTMPGGYSYGIMDPLTGEMVIPFGPYAGNGTYPGAGECTVVENGRMILTREATWDDETWVPLLLRDNKGQVVQELPEREGLEVYWGRLENGLAPAYDQAAGLWGFVDLKGNWAIQPQYCNYDSFFVWNRAIVCREDENGNWRYGVIDSQGREVLPFRYPGLSYRGEGLYRTGPISADPGELYWVREDGSQVKNGYLTHDIYCINGYIALHNRYLDENFQYATPAEFDWTGPINESGSGFVGKDGKVYRIQFEKR